MAVWRMLIAFLLLSIALQTCIVLAWSTHSLKVSRSPLLLRSEATNRQQQPTQLDTLHQLHQQQQQQQQSPAPVPRRTRKNKYENFSKVTKDTDPFEELLAETNEKVQALQEEQERKEQQRQQSQRKQLLLTDLPPAPKLSFPDNKEIDPYDPTTFGYTEIGHVTGAHGVHGWLKIKSTTDFPQQRLCTPGIRHLKAARKRAPRQIVLVQGKQKRDDEYLVQIDDVVDRDAALQLRGSTLYARQEENVLADNKKRNLNNNEKDANTKEPLSNASTTTTATSENNEKESEETKEQKEEEEEYLVSDLVGLEVRMLVEENEDRNEDDEDDENPESSNDSAINSKEGFVGYVNGLVLAEDMCAIPGLGHDTLEVILQQGPVPSFRDELVLVPLVPQIVPKVDIANGYLLIDPPSGLLDLTYVRSERVRIKGFLPYQVDDNDEMDNTD